MSAAPQFTVAIPETAPFSPEQRSWLSGFFSASVAAMAAEAPVASNDASATKPDGPVLATNDEAPWHDPSMEPEARMEMAKDRPIAPRLMAAMAQQDCGQCGYNCADYANAIFLKSEERLNLCAPGGKVTARLLKGLAVELNDVNGDKTAADVGAAEGGKSRAVESAQAGIVPGTSREAPATAVFKSRRRLNQEGSAKDTWHVEFDLSQSGVSYVVGDSFGVFPKNNQGLVDQIIAMLGASHMTEIDGKTLRQVLREDVDLGLAPDSLFELFSYISGGKSREKARALAKGEDPDGDAAQLDVLAVLHKFPNVRPHPEAFVDALSPLQPRLYSISSSPNLNLGGLSLTVDAVRYQINKRKRTGVASTWLADAVEPGEALKVYVPEGAQLRPAGGPGDARHHGGARHRRGALPGLPAGAQGLEGARQELAVLRPPEIRDRLLLPRGARGAAQGGRADAPVARLVARCRGEVLRAGPHARGRRRPVALARGRRPRLRLRRRQAHGQGRRGRARRDRRHGGQEDHG